MAEPIVSPFVGIGMGIPGLTTLVLKLLDGWKEFFRTMKTAERDGELLFTRFDHLTQRYTALQAVLFQHGKFDFVRGAVFDNLPGDQRYVLKAMFLELARLLYSFYQLSQNRNIGLLKPAPGSVSFDITLSPEQVAIMFSETDIVPRHGKARLRMSWTDFAWAASNKKHTENLMDQYEDWLGRIRETMEDFWWPQTFFEKFSNLEALEQDKDFQATGMDGHTRLRKLLLDDSPFRPTLELKGPQSNLGELKDTTVSLRKLGRLEGKPVFVEIMPFKVDSDGFLPAELRRRFCRIAALLNTQHVSELKVLRCLRWREVQEYDGSVSATSFQLISAFPVGSSEHFQTLSEIIRSFRGNKKPSLDRRFGVCYTLAQSLSHCFSVGWRHRSIRSSNVLVFFREEEMQALGDKVLAVPFLCGFEESRLQGDYSMKKHGDDSIASNVYRHPDRWGTPTSKFSIYHDLYAFGVLLLEVGLWEPILDILKRYAGKKAVPSLASEEVQAALLKATKAEAGHKCGSRYRRMIEMCLTSDFGVDDRADTRLQTEVQKMFRREILDGLTEGQEAVTAG